MKHIIENKRTSRTTIKRIFKTYIKSILLYYSGLWSMDKRLEEDIDVFQRNLIRRALKIDWKDKIRNEDLYKMIGLRAVSKIVKERRLRWLGHKGCLPEDTPVRIAFTESMRKTKKTRGGQKQTWHKLVEKDLKVVNMSLDCATKYAQSRSQWKTMTHCIMSEFSDGRCQ